MRSDAPGREQTTAPILLHAANQRLTAISTKPPCTQLTPSSAERARRERRHPKASTAKKSLALDPLENNIDVNRTLRIATVGVAMGGRRACKGRFGNDGVRAKAAVRLRARNSLHRPKRKQNFACNVRVVTLGPIDPAGTLSGAELAGRPTLNNLPDLCRRGL